MNGGFSRQFPQQEQGKDQGQRIPFSPRFSPVFHLFKGMIQRSRIDGRCSIGVWLNRIKYGKVHLEPFLAFLGSLMFSYSSRKRLFCLLFGTLKKPCTVVRGVGRIDWDYFVLQRYAEGRYMVEAICEKLQEETERKEQEVAQSDYLHESRPLIDPSLAFRMGLVSLARFGVLGDFLRWVKS
jgi:hypothetical protein